MLMFAVQPAYYGKDISGGKVEQSVHIELLARQWCNSGKEIILLSNFTAAVHPDDPVPLRCTRSVDISY